MYKKNIITTSFFALLLVMLLIPVPITASISGNADQGQGLYSRQIVITPNSSRVIISGVETSMEAVPYIENGTTMIPLRFLSQQLLNANVHWNQSERTVFINDGSQTIVINLKQNKAVINGFEYILSPPPVLRDGHTYVPLRFLAEAAGLQVTYNPGDKTITISSSFKQISLPVADFTLPEGLIAGQALTYQDKSRDPLGRAIVDYVWTIEVDGKKINTNSLTAALSKPASGDYLISLRVKNSVGIWSDLTTKRLTVAPNQPPKIMDFTSKKTQVAIGEDLEFTYSVENEEDWEKITAERWSYSWFDGSQWQLKREKPRAFFYPGDHIVNLQVKDEYGNWSEEVETTIRVTEKVVKTEEAFKFSNPVPGELFLNHSNTNFNLLADAAARIVHRDDVTLIASNNPEKIKEPGILYQDQATDRVRVRYHHKNDSKSNINVYVIAENTTDSPVELLLLKRGMAGPSTDIMQAGQQVVTSYLQSNHYQKLTLQPGEKVILNKEQKTLKPQELLAGLIDVHAGGQLVFTIVASKDNQTAVNYQNMAFLSKENSHVRGTFSQANKYIDVEIKGVDKEKIIIGRNDAFPDYFLQGIDSITGEQVINRGNRGVVYTITIKAEQTVGVLFNPRGTIYKGAMLGFDNKIWYLPNAGTLHGSKEGVVLGIIKQGETKTITYVPPSGSDTPFLLVFIPENKW
ncbi:MAG: stalk domain-containing protein [Bacillota bacterium]